MKIEMLVLADDFTGALDTGIQFAKLGAGTRVTTDKECDFSKTDAQVLVIDTETRHLPPAKAGRVIEEIARRARACGVRKFYKKTDSALRGNAGAEMEALLHASGGKCIHFFPAYPVMNRVVRGGVLYIDGVPAAKSMFGKDPFDPVRRSSVRDILGDQTGIPVLSAEERPGTSGNREGIILYDSETDEELLRKASGLWSDLEKAAKLNRCPGKDEKLWPDLNKTAQALPDSEPVLFAGCAGLASCLAQLMSAGDFVREEKLRDVSGFLVVSGSVNEVTKRQIRKAREDGFGYANLTIREKLTDYLWTDEGGGCRRELLRKVSENRRFIVDTADPDGGENALEWGKAHGMDAKHAADRIADNLARLVMDLIEQEKDRMLLLTGGDVLFHTMQVMGVTELQPLAEVSPGVILSLFRYQGVIRQVLTKSGGFGKEDLLAVLAEQYAGG